MTRRPPPSIPERRPVFVGCEGESEVAYAGLLQDMLREAGIHVHLVVHDLGCGAGDPLARIQLAVQRLAQLRRTRIAPPERFILLDGDQAARDSARAGRARLLAAQYDITIVWQEPCFEALLLHDTAATRHAGSGAGARARMAGLQKALVAGDTRRAN